MIRSGLKVFILMSILLVMLGALFIFLNHWRIDEIYLTKPLKYADQQKIEQIFKEYPSAFSLLINYEKIRLKIAESDWVSSGNLRLQLPGKLLVSVDETQPVAIWNKTFFLDNEMKIVDLKPRNQASFLPCINAAIGSEFEALQQYRNFAYLIRKHTGDFRLRQLQHQPGGVVMLGLQLMSNLRNCHQSDIEIVLGNGLEDDGIMAFELDRLEEFAKKNIEERLKQFLVRGKRQYMALSSGARYDLRYPSGFAINTDRLILNQY